LDRPDAILPLLENDLEPAAVQLCPPVARLRTQLGEAGAQAVGMSGSGPTVFGVFPGVREAEEALAGMALEAPGWSRVAVAAKSG
jgi:4-diphosphocytidyl-2-C-methyl-D-erythritol kinase